MDAGPAQATWRVLLVDDDPLIREAVGRWFLGGRAGVAGRLVRQLDRADRLDGSLAETAADLVLLDLDMPGDPPLDVLCRVRRRPQAPPVLILSGLLREEVVIEALAAGAAGYVMKDDAPGCFAEAFAAVQTGRPYLSPAVLGLHPHLSRLTA